MCDFCLKVAASSLYQGQLREWLARDAAKLETTKPRAAGDSSLVNSFFSNMGFPVSISIPLFEPRLAMPIPSNYYQNAFVDGARLQNGWTHDNARSIGFLENGDLFFLAKAAAKAVGAREYSLFFHAVRFEKSRGEFRLSVDVSGRVLVEVKDVKKAGVDLLTGRPSERVFSFAFQHSPTEKAILPKERAAAFFASRAAAGAVRTPSPRTSGSSFEEYIVSIPHVAPHPYLLQAYEELGFASRMELQNSVSSFFKAHAQV